MSVIIYHNPHCTKSRQTLALLRENGVEPDVIEYLKTPPSYTELADIIKKLGITPHQLLRTKEAEYKTLSLDKKDISDKQIINAMIEVPKLMERPIVINADKAAIGRPPENVLEIL
jgi:arsenate reductase